jgi:uncharacterized protein (DUF2164 family)
MKQTALQQAFSDLEELHPNLFNINTTEGKKFVHHFHKYIAMEKEQIIDAFEHVDFNLDDGLHYYNQTFNKSINNKG